MPDMVKVTIEVEVDPGEETRLLVKPFGTTLVEESSLVGPIGIPGGGPMPVPKASRTLTEKGTGRDRAPDASDTDYD
jgi:hypothetical protein